MLVSINGREAVAVLVFLLFFTIASVKTFEFLSGINFPINLYSIVMFFSIFMYAIFSIASALIKVFVGK